MSLKDSLAAMVAEKVRAVEVPEWGRTVHVRQLGAAAVADLHDRRLGPDFVPLLVVHGACEPDGSPAFAAADLDFVRDVLPGLGTLRVAQAVADLNKLTESEADAKNG